MTPGRREALVLGAAGLAAAAAGLLAGRLLTGGSAEDGALKAATFPDLKGKPRPLAEWQGRVVVLNFWATWCAPCRREIPLLNRLYQQYSGQRLQIVGVAVDFKDEVAKYVKLTHFAYPLLVGEQTGLEAAEKFGMEMALPFSIFVDSQQRIVAAKVGELHRDDADAIIQALNAVDRGALPIEQAKTQIGAKLHELAVSRATK
jgi:thiol-disulfide isomerase/thioredoxin